MRDAMVDEDGRALTAMVWSAFRLEVRLVPGGASATLRTPDVVRLPTVEGSWSDAADTVTERALHAARDLLPDRYLAWHEARTTMDPEPRLRDGDDLRSLDAVLTLLRARFDGVMSAPEVHPGTEEGDEVRVRLYGRFDLVTGLEAPHRTFYRTLAMPWGGYLHNLPGERPGVAGTPGSVRRAYRVLDEYCRARLDLPPRTDDEETP
ncbi:hypothetical protein AB6N23_04850 [Cellulomonas sp. 179-A 9B4 NHS]|uniref:hypothetical protein n=1 Tax=Cellulomonas sp. 179-A 9B4 NHS TaxID=3142379 RepID=UPI0039A37624